MGAHTGDGLWPEPFGNVYSTGHSGSAVKFPRILGIECVGVVEAAPGTPLTPGQKVAAVMGGMGRDYDGSYAEYTLVPATQVMPVATDLPWEKFAAIPETFLTAWGSLVESLNVRNGNTLLIRGGTSSVGMAALTLAKDLGVTVVATTRNAKKKQALIANGADHVVIDQWGHLRCCSRDLPNRCHSCPGVDRHRDAS